MNILDNIAWLQDLAHHSANAGSANQEQRLLELATHIMHADELLSKQNKLLDDLNALNLFLQAELQTLQNRIDEVGA